MESPAESYIGAVAFALTYVGWVASVRMNSYRRLNNTDMPRTALEAQKISARIIYNDFPFISTKALEFGLFKTYAIPSISKVLVATRELVDHCARRYDDTDLIVREIWEQPFNTWRAELALKRMNALHSKYVISNEDYLYVLTVFAVEPYRWIDKFGYRRSHPLEKECSHLIWTDIGTKMGIKNIPGSYEALEKYLDDYEEANMKYHPNNAHLAKHTMQLLLSNMPSFLHPFGRNAVYALCDARLRKAMGFPEPPILLPEILHGMLFAAGLFTRLFLPPRVEPARRTPQSSLDGASQPQYGVRLCPVYHPFEPTYKNGYQIEELGPEKFVTQKELGQLHT
jgi:hypothetical protein